MSGSLPLALGRIGIETLVVMPRYRGLSAADKRLTENVRIAFVENEAYFNRAGIYGNDGGDYADNLHRFAFFCDAALEVARQKGFKPDIVHAHDWQTALAPVLLKTKLKNDPFFKNARTLLTVHNLAFQGTFPAKQFADLGLDKELFSVNGFEFFGKLSLLKAGLLFADAISTVSPTYAKEIQTHEYGCGLEGVVRGRAGDLTGILNGIDNSVWNPNTDKRIKRKFSAAEPAGKAGCKAELQKVCGLEVNPEIPVFAIVSRLTEQKGLELVSEVADEWLSKKVQLVVLGEGDGVYHTTLRNIAARYPKTTDVNLGFDAEEAHRIYAGCDFFLMPSFFEPCGLGQMIALRYGAVPIVRKTGGLADTIVDADADARRGNGFVFESRLGGALMKAIERALAAYADRERFLKIMKTGMKCDFSWKRSAARYRETYQSLLKEGRP